MSTLDWVVSKLASPKLEDVLEHPDVTLEMLHRIEDRMYEYGGVSAERALNDLHYLIRELGEMV